MEEPVTSAGSSIGRELNMELPPRKNLSPMELGSRWAETWFDGFSAPEFRSKKVAVLVEAKFADTVGKAFIDDLSKADIEVALLCFWTHRRVSFSGQPLIELSRTFLHATEECEEFICLQPDGISEDATNLMLQYINPGRDHDATLLFITPYESKRAPIGKVHLNKFRRTTIVSSGHITLKDYEAIAVPEPDDFPDIVKSRIAADMVRLRRIAVG